MRFMSRKKEPRHDAVQSHLDAYPPRPDGEVIRHMREEHPVDYRRWGAGQPVNDLMILHYSAHSRKVTAEQALDASVARHPAGKKRGTQ